MVISSSWPFRHCFCSQLLSPPPPQGIPPQVYLDDGSGIYQNFTSITAAAAAASSGDRILIQGATTSTGEALAYSNATTGESFPIGIPAGVVVRNFDSTPVYVVTTLSNTSLFSVTGVSGTAPATSFIKLNLIGAGVSSGGSSNAAAISLSSNDKNIDALIKNVNLGRNTTGIRAHAAGGLIELDIDGCKIIDGSPVQNPVPNAANFTTGIRLTASDGSAAGVVQATISNLSTTGLFPKSRMRPAGYYSGARHDLEAYADKITRLVQVGATGDIREFPPNFLNPTPISRVELDVQGGVWNGQATQAETGWDVGLYAETGPYVGPQEMNFHAAFEVSMAGTEVKNFKAAGIYGETMVETRGEIALSQVHVHDIGTQFLAKPTTSPVHNGVHLASSEAYLAFVASDSEFSDNRGDGVYLFTPHSEQHPPPEPGATAVPTGLFVGMDHCGMHGNSLRGLGMDAARNKPHVPYVQGGVVGGTWDFYATAPNRSYVVESNEPTFPYLPNQGQGYVNACAISNNGRPGVEVFVHGMPLEMFHHSSASVRFVNTYVWNHDNGGVKVDLMPHANAPMDAPLLLMPLVHCTLAHNGGLVPWTMEVSPINIGSGTPTPQFRWLDYTNGPEQMTSLFNTIFERANPTDDAFGMNLAGLLRFDDNQPNTVPPNEVGWAGIRAWSGVVASDIFSTTSASPFEGPVNPPSRSVPQFFLDNNSGPPIFFQSPPYLNAGYSLSEDTVDYEGTFRPALLERDKGGEED